MPLSQDQFDALWTKVRNTPNPYNPQLGAYMDEVRPQLDDAGARSKLQEILVQTATQAYKRKDKAGFGYLGDIQGAIKKFSQGYVPPIEGSKTEELQLPGTTVDRTTGAISHRQQSIPQQVWTPEEQQAQAGKVAAARESAIAAGNLESTPVRQQAIQRLKGLAQPQQGTGTNAADVGVSLADAALKGSPIGLFAQTPGERYAIASRLLSPMNPVAGIDAPVMGDAIAQAQARAQFNSPSLMAAGNTLAELGGGSVGYGLVGRGVNAGLQAAGELPGVGKAVQGYLGGAEKLAEWGKATKGGTGFFSPKGNVGAAAQALGRVGQAAPTVGAVGAASTAQQMAQGQPFSQAIQPSMTSLYGADQLNQEQSGLGAIPKQAFQAMGFQGVPDIKVPTAAMFPLAGHLDEFAPQNSLFGGPIRKLGQAYNLSPEFFRKSKGQLPPVQPAEGEVKSAEGVQEPQSVERPITPGELDLGLKNLTKLGDKDVRGSGGWADVLRGDVPLGDLLYHPAETKPAEPAASMGGIKRVIGEDFDPNDPQQLNAARDKIAAMVKDQGDQAPDAIRYMNSLIGAYTDLQAGLSGKNKLQMPAILDWMTKPNYQVGYELLRRAARQFDPATGLPDSTAKYAALTLEAARQALRGRQAAGKAVVGATAPAGPKDIRAKYPDATSSLEALNKFIKQKTRDFKGMREGKANYAEAKDDLAKLTALRDEMVKGRGKPPEGGSGGPSETPPEEPGGPTAPQTPPGAPSAPSTEGAPAQEAPKAPVQLAPENEAAIKQEIESRHKTVVQLENGETVRINKAQPKAAKATMARTDQIESSRSRQQHEIIPEGPSEKGPGWADLTDVTEPTETWQQRILQPENRGYLRSVKAWMGQFLRSVSSAPKLEDVPLAAGAPAPKTQPKGVTPGRPEVKGAPRIEPPSVDLYGIFNRSAAHESILADDTVRAATHELVKNAKGEPIYRVKRLDAAGLNELSAALEDYFNRERSRIAENVRTPSAHRRAVVYDQVVAQPLLKRVDEMGAALKAREAELGTAVNISAEPAAVTTSATDSVRSNTSRTGKFAIVKTRRDLTDTQVPFDSLGTSWREDYGIRRAAGLDKNADSIRFADLYAASVDPNLNARVRRNIQGAIANLVAKTYGEQAELKFANGRHYVEQPGTEAHVPELIKRIGIINDELIRDKFEDAPQQIELPLDSFIKNGQVDGDRLRHSMPGGELVMKDGTNIKVGNYLPIFDENKGFAVEGRWIDPNDIASVLQTRADLQPGPEITRGNLKAIVGQLLGKSGETKATLSESEQSSLRDQLTNLSQPQLSSLRSYLIQANDNYDSKSWKRRIASAEYPKGVDVSPAVDRAIKIVDSILEGRASGTETQGRVKLSAADEGIRQRERRSEMRHRDAGLAEESQRESTDMPGGWGGVREVVSGKNVDVNAFEKDAKEIPATIATEVEKWKTANPGQPIPDDVRKDIELTAWQKVMDKHKDTMTGVKIRTVKGKEVGEEIEPQEAAEPSSTIPLKAQRRSGMVEFRYARGVAQRALENPGVIPQNDRQLHKLMGIIADGHRGQWTTELAHEADTVSKSITNRLAAAKLGGNYGSGPFTDVDKLTLPQHDVAPETIERIKRREVVATEGTPDVNPNVPYNITNVVNRATKWLEDYRAKNLNASRVQRTSEDLNALHEIGNVMRSARTNMDFLAKQGTNQVKSAGGGVRYVGRKGRSNTVSFSVPFRALPNQMQARLGAIRKTLSDAAEAREAAKSASGDPARKALITQTAIKLERRAEEMRRSSIANEVRNVEMAEQRAAVIFRGMGEKYGLYGIDPKTGRARNRGMATIMARHPEVMGQEILGHIQEATPPPAQFERQSGDAGLVPAQLIRVTDPGVPVAPTPGGEIFTKTSSKMVNGEETFQLSALPPPKSNTFIIHKADGTGETLTLQELRAKAQKEGDSIWNDVSAVYTPLHTLFDNTGSFIGKGIVDKELADKAAIGRYREEKMDELENEGYTRAELEKMSPEELADLGDSGEGEE